MNENLLLQRDESDAWARPAAPDPGRWLIGGAGLACILAASRRRSAAGVLLAMAGGALVWWAAGSDEERRLRSAALRRIGRTRAGVDDPVDVASEGSFPASDPPSSMSPADGRG